MPKKTDKPQADSNKKTKKKNPVGRPTKYNLELATRICEEIATTTDSYAKICERNPDFPDVKNMRLWRYRHAEFRPMYDQAKRDQAALLIEEIEEISDNQERDLIETEKGWMVNSAKVQRDKLRVDTRKWIACKLIPKIYGEKNTEDVSRLTEGDKQAIKNIMSDLMVKHEREY